MTTGSLCLTEILMSRKSCSSNSEHSHSADSTSASGVALPYLASSRLSSEPALTPIRIGMPASLAARAISATLSSNALMLPGLTRTAAQPASIAANTYFGWKWMSAITGICDLRGDHGQRVGVVLRRHGDPHDLAAGRGQLGDLLQRGVDVRGHRGGHRLHRHRARRRRPGRVLPAPCIWRDLRRGASGRAGMSAAGRDRQSWYRRSDSRATWTTHARSGLTRSAMISIRPMKTTARRRRRS